MWHVNISFVILSRYFFNGTRRGQEMSDDKRFKHPKIYVFYFVSKFSYYQINGGLGRKISWIKVIFFYI